MFNNKIIKMIPNIRIRINQTRTIKIVIKVIIKVTAKVNGLIRIIKINLKIHTLITIIIINLNGKIIQIMVKIINIKMINRIMLMYLV